MDFLHFIILIVCFIIYSILTNLFTTKIIEQLIEAKNIKNANPFPMALLCGWITALIFYGLLPNNTTLKIQMVR